jgi:hypothetical protein
MKKSKDDDSPPCWGEGLLSFSVALTVYPFTRVAGFVLEAALLGFRRGRQDLRTCFEIK